MSWFKEEFKNKEEIKSAIDFMELYFFNIDSQEKKEIIDNIYESLLNNPEKNNPLISLSWYLVFESVVLIPILPKITDNSKFKLPLWCYNNRSRNMNLAFEPYSREYYESYCVDSDILDKYGTIGEFELFLEKFSVNIEKYYPGVVSEYGVWNDIKNNILNPSWEKDKYHKKHNQFFDSDDWQYHEVFSSPRYITRNRELTSID